MENIGCCHKHIECQQEGECLNISLLKGRNYECYLRLRLERKNNIKKTFTNGPKDDIIKLTKSISTKKEVVGMSKKHSKKAKRVERRVPVTPEEEKRVFESRLAKLKGYLQDVGTVVEEKEMVLNSKKKEKPANAPPKTKTGAGVYNGPLVTLKELAFEFGVEGGELRKKLRSSSLEKPSGRWEWSSGHPDLDVIREMYGKSTSKPKAKPVHEEDEADYEDMTEKELRALCKERDLDYDKGADKDELIELLQKTDEEDYEDEDYEDGDGEEEGSEEEAGEEDGEEPEDDDEDDDEDDEEPGYESMTKRGLLALCKERGLPASKKLDKEEIIKLLEDADNEEYDEEDEEVDYEELELDELSALCKGKGIRLPKKLTHPKLVELLMEYDNENE